MTRRVLGFCTGAALLLTAFTGPVPANVLVRYYISNPDCGSDSDNDRNGSTHERARVTTSVLIRYEDTDGTALFITGWNDEFDCSMEDQNTDPIAERTSNGLLGVLEGKVAWDVGKAFQTYVAEALTAYSVYSPYANLGRFLVPGIPAGFAIAAILADAA